MAKLILEELIPTDAFQTWIDRTNEIIDLAKSDFVTASANGDFTTGNVTLSGNFTANTVTSNDTRIRTNSLSSRVGSLIESNSVFEINTSVQTPMILTNSSGARIEYSSDTTSWFLGFENTVNNKFAFMFNSSTVILAITPSGVLEAVTGSFSSVTSPTFVGNLAGNADTVTNGVYTSGNQTIAGLKTFSSGVVATSFTGNLTGNASTVTNGVYLTGNQTIAGDKTFSSALVLSTPGTLPTHAVRSDRSVSTGTGLTGGGNLSADRFISLTGQALAFHNLSGTGLVTRTGADTVVTRTLLGGTAISIINGSGVSGNPTVSATIASQAEALAGTDDTKLMTPLKIVQSDSRLYGTKWVNREVTTLRQYTSIASDGKMFVAVANGGGSGNRVLTSYDGITWSNFTSGTIQDISWEGITWGNGLFVAVASNISFAGSTAQVMTSPDGVVWTMRSAPARQWNAVTYGNGLFVAVATSGTDSRVMTSTDGITWTSRTSAADNTWQSVAYGNGLFVAVASNSTRTGPIMTSPDGISWTGRSIPFRQVTFGSSTAASLYGVTYGNGLFVAVGSQGGGVSYPLSAEKRILTSPDGITWTERVSPVNNIWRCVAWNGAIFVACSDNGGFDRIITSSDGITWAVVDVPVDAGYQSIAWNGERWAACASATGSIIDSRIMTSTL